MRMTWNLLLQRNHLDSSFNDGVDEGKLVRKLLDDILDKTIEGVRFGISGRSDRGHGPMIAKSSNVVLFHQFRGGARDV